MTRKILFYTHAFAGGGAEIVFGRLARAFAERGDTVVFAADHVGNRAPRDTDRLRHVILGPNHVGSTLRLANLLRRERPDASFSALGAQNLKHVVAAALTGRRSRCMLGYHGFAEAEPKRLSRLSYQLSPLTTRLAAQTVCVSDTLLQNVAARWGGRKLARIWNPVPSPIEGDAAPPRDPALVLALGRLIPAKRFGDLIAAVAYADDRTMRLVILGEGPERANLEALVARHALGDRVRLAGHVDDPSPWYRQAACVAIASESESFGLTAAEALAHGVPVTTTDCGGPPEVLAGDPACGRVVKVGDVEALATALTATLAAPGDSAPRRARAAAFSPDTIHAAYAALADSLG